MADVAFVFLLLLYAAMVLGMLVGAVLAPFVLVAEVGRRAFVAWQAHKRIARPTPANRAVTTRELKEQYAIGTLSMTGLEERVAEVLRADSHFELSSVLDDLPRSAARAHRVVVFDVCAGVALLLVEHSTMGRVAAVLLALGAFVVIPRRGAVLYAFFSGVAVFAAPLAALPLGASAWLRWREERALDA
jgi:hypothetical protein